MFSDVVIYFQNVVCLSIGVCNLYLTLNGACAYQQKRMRSPLTFIREIALSAISRTQTFWKYLVTLDSAHLLIIIPVGMCKILITLSLILPTVDSEIFA